MRVKRLLTSDKMKEKREKIIDRIKWVIPRDDGTDQTVISGKRILLLVLIGLIFLSVVMFFPLYLDIWEIIHADTVMAVLFWFSLFLIYPLWGITTFISSWFAKIPLYVIREELTERVKKTRIYFGIFALSLLAYKNIPYFQNEWGLTDLQTQGLALLLSIITTLLSFYVTRLLRK